MLAIDLAGEHIARLASATGEVSIDLEAELLDIGADEPIGFKVDPGDRKMLLNGLDYIDFALQYSADIDRFITADRQRRPWAYLERKT